MTRTRWPAVAIALAGALAAPAGARAQQGESLLPVYAIVDDSLQLQSGKVDVSTYEDVEYAKNVKDCVVAVEKRVGAWLSTRKLAPSSRRVQDSQYRLEIDLQSPKTGTLVIHYAWLPSKRLASLDLRFLASERLTQSEREKLVFGLDLVTLRTDLAASMKCS